MFLLATALQVADAVSAHRLSLPAVKDISDEDPIDTDSESLSPPNSQDFAPARRAKLDHLWKHSEMDDVVRRPFHSGAQGLCFGCEFCRDDHVGQSTGIRSSVVLSTFSVSVFSLCVFSVCFVLCDFSVCFVLCDFSLCVFSLCFLSVCLLSVFSVSVFSLSASFSLISLSVFSLCVFFLCFLSVCFLSVFSLCVFSLSLCVVKCQQLQQLVRNTAALLASSDPQHSLERSGTTGVSSNSKQQQVRQQTNRRRKQTNRHTNKEQQWQHHKAAQDNKTM